MRTRVYILYTWKPFAATVSTVMKGGSVAVGMMQVAEASGLNRESLYKMLSEKGNPEFVSIDRLVHAWG